MALDVDQVCTDLDLEGYVGGQSNLQKLLDDDPRFVSQDGETKTAKPTRARILGDILTTLKRRDPPILEASLADPKDLGPCTCYGTLEALYLGAAKFEDSPYIGLAKIWGAKYAAEQLALAPSIIPTDGGSPEPAPSSIGFSHSRG